jgi:hypothetical protein
VVLFSYEAVQHNHLGLLIGLLAASLNVGEALAECINTVIHPHSTVEGLKLLSLPEVGSDEEGRNDEPHHRGADRNYRETLLDQLCRQFVHAAGKVAGGGIIPMWTPGVLMEVIAPRH